MVAANFSDEALTLLKHFLTILITRAPGDILFNQQFKIQVFLLDFLNYHSKLLPINFLLITLSIVEVLVSCFRVVRSSLRLILMKAIFQ